ncbi:hypothetical protein EXS73_02255 [Candidatus Pacearchaeota archaeon]|nr:hypothetical protein [Candidatus Pacearchaeota archaeon]
MATRLVLANIALSRGHLVQLEHESLEFPHSFPTSEGTSIPRSVDVSLGLAHKGELVSMQYFPEEVSPLNASTYRFIFSEAGLKQLVQGDEVYCPFGPTEGVSFSRAS